MGNSVSTAAYVIFSHISFSPAWAYAIILKRTDFYRYLSIASVSIGCVLLPVNAAGQSAAAADYINPQNVGYLYRASDMLVTGNPLGTIQQLDAICARPSSAEELALLGGALFLRDDERCIETLNRLADNYPTSEYSTQALLTLGDWYWYRKDWHEAIRYYSRVDIDALGSGQRDLYTYRKALAYLNCGMPEVAAPLFSSLVGKSGYDSAAQYYSAYILYLKGDYDRAYDMFKRLDASEGIQPLYYMAQIEYLKGRYADVASHATRLLAGNPLPELTPELNRLAGLSLFKTGDLAGARPYLEKFVASVDSPNDDALYALAATDYDSGDLASARGRFRSLTDRNNMLAQGSYLYLGQIALQEGDLNEAAMAFRKAANMAFDPNVAETAAYNYIAANSKGGNVPFASSIGMHEDFLRKYPSSAYASEVQESLAAALFHENDYAKALEAIRRVKNPSPSTYSTLQKILYKLGCGEVATGQNSQAAGHLREAADMKTGDRTVAAESALWLGEALYRSGKFAGAASAYSQALSQGLSAENTVMARYGLAYALFQQEKWNDAEKNFAAVASSPLASANMVSDAIIREADCLLYMRQFEKAGQKYSKAIADNVGDTDYAAFRHAVVAGVVISTERELKELDAFISEREDSRWLPDVLLEAARTWTALERPDKAAVYYDRLLTVRPDSPQVAEALLNKAKYLEDSGDRSGALEAYLALEQSGGKDFATEATAGVMRTTDDIALRAQYAEMLMDMGGVSVADAEDARFYRGAGLLHGPNPEAGIAALTALADSPDNLSGAKAAVELGEWYLENDRVADALAVLEKFTDAGSIHSYWLARGFIALADAYHADGNDYLAAEYLRSLKENYPGSESDIRSAISKKLKIYTAE